jgi:hypothetical protein
LRDETAGPAEDEAAGPAEGEWSHPDLVEPLIIMRDSVSRVSLLETECHVHIPGEEGATTGWIKFETLGASREVQARVEFETSSPPEVFLGQGAEIGVSGERFSASVRFDHTSMVTSTDSLFDQDHRRIVVAGHTQSTQLTVGFSEGDATKSIVAHVYDMPEYRGRTTTVHSRTLTSTTGQRLHIQVANWDVLVDSYAPWISIYGSQQDAEPFDPTTREWSTAALSNPFFGNQIISHGIRALRRNGGTFGIKSATRFLDRMEIFLAFAFGRRIPLAYRFGLDHEGEQAWLQFDTARTPRPPSGTRSIRSWSPLTAITPRQSRRSDDVADFEQAARGFYDVLSSEGEVLQRVVEWYVAALGASGSSACLVLAQAGLELLAFEHLAMRLHIRESSRQRIDVADQFRALLSDVGVPLAVPAELQQVLSAKGNMDGAEWVTQGRNRAVHPTLAIGKAGVVSAEHVPHIEKLALQYLELSILRLIGYSGNFWDRISNIIRPVPWVTDDN